MSVPSVPPKKKLPVMKLAVAAIVLVVGAILVLRGVEIRPLIDRFIATIRDAGPVVFFLAMALTPAVGAPLSIFGLAAGQAFAPSMTMAGVIIAAMVAIAVNLSLTYWLARRALRPLLSRLVAQYGYTVPRVTPDNALSVTLIVRFTGAPFFVQNYVLGLAEVPFGLYLLVSWLATAPFAVAFIVLGKAFSEGGFTKIITAIGLLVAAVIIVQVLRKKFAKREN